MKNCPNCRNQVNDSATFCPVCGTTLDAIGHIEIPQFHKEPAAPLPSAVPVQEVPKAWDHTQNFCKSDIAENKLLCMSVYLLGAVGIIIGLLMSPKSEFTRFHVRQSLKFIILEALILLFSAILCWTFIVPILGMIALLVLLIAKILCFVDVCRGKAVESSVLQYIKFLS